LTTEIEIEAVIDRPNRHIITRSHRLDSLHPHHPHTVLAQQSFHPHQDIESGNKDSRRV
jgi:hypothetical protein